MNNGLTSGDLWAFEQLCLKANDEQLPAMRKAIAHHEMNRERNKLSELIAKVPA